MTLLVEALSCSRGGCRVFEDVGFGLAPGDVLVLRGPNGAGKTTLLRALAGLVAVDAGRVRLEGHAPGEDGYEAEVAYAGHLDALKPQLTVAENLRFWSGVLGGGAVGPCLEALDLGGLADRPVHACSAGQKRRAGLARLLLAPRRLWLLDEPTVALDTDSTARLLDLVARHRAGGGMAVVSTHGALALPGPRELSLGGGPGRAPGAARHAGDPFLAGRWT